MISLLCNWKGKVSINDKQYNNIVDALDYVPAEGTPVIIKLYPLVGEKRYNIKVKKYMTQCATDSFPFMENWNNNIPMPSTEMTGGIKVRQTPGMVYMKFSNWEGWIIKSAIIKEEEVESQ